jgi:hypothetical protein
MPRFLSEPALVAATHNAGKVIELKELLEGRGWRVVSAADLGLPVPEENGAHFVENAAIKARAAATASGLPALADDSGFCVAALGGLPGKDTALWAERPDGSRDYPWAGTPTAPPGSFARWRSPGPTARSRPSRAGSMAGSRCRRAAPAASASTPPSRPKATPRPSARWTRRRST